MSNNFRLPSINDFAIGQGIDLYFCLESVEKKRKRSDLLEIFRKEYFDDKVKKFKNDPDERYKRQIKSASNIIIAMRCFELVENNSKKNDEIRLTSIGKELLNKKYDIRKIFGVHLMDNLCGEHIIIAMNTCEKRGFSRIHKEQLAIALNEIGIRTYQGKKIGGNTTDHSKFVKWMQWCGILDNNNKINEDNYRNYFGRSSELISTLWSLEDEQFLFLKYIWETYRRKDENQFLVRHLISDSQTEYGDYIKQKDQIKKNIIIPLENAGLIKIIPVQKKGRGGNSGRIEITSKLKDLKNKDFDKKDNSYTKQPIINKSLEEIFSQIESSDRYIKGIALENLVLYTANALNLNFVGYRVRSRETGGSEIDIIFEKIDISYTKWLIQCKNTPSKKNIDVGVIAKEVGNALILHANIIVIITTSEFSSEAEKFRKKTIENTNLQILFINGKDLNNFKIQGNAYLLKRINLQNEEIAEIRGLKDTVQ